MLFSIIINVALKIAFHVPLNPSLHMDWYAFPSGHMQLSTVIYGCLAYKITNRHFRTLMAALLIGIGGSLIYFGYHNMIDVIGGFVCGVLLILLYIHILHEKPWMVLLSASIATLYSVAVFSPMPLHALIAYFTLCVLVIIQIARNCHLRRVSVARYIGK